MFPAQNWPVLKNSLRRKNVFTFEMARKFATRASDFEENLNFDPDEIFAWGPPLLNFQNFKAAFLSSMSAQDNETLHADSRSRWGECHRF